MVPAMATECVVDDKIQEDDVNMTESKDSSPSTDSTPSGESAYVLIQ